MNALSDDIVSMLEDSSALGLSGGTNLFTNFEPKDPDTCVTVYDTPSFPPEFALDNQTSYWRSSCQIRIRDENQVDGMSLARNIMDYLHNRANEEWGGVLYTVIRATGEPALLDWDGNDRPRFIINFNCQRR